MNLAPHAFPNRDILPSETVAITEACQLDGVENADAVTQFTFEARPVLKKGELLTGYLHIARAMILDGLSREDAAASVDFSNGALFYIATFRRLNPGIHVPAVNRAVSTVVTQGNKDLALSASCDIQQSAETFCNFMKYTLAPLGQTSHRGDLAVIGAGAVHLLVVQSEHIIAAELAYAETEKATMQRWQEIEALDAAFPDLQRLAIEFDNPQPE